MFDAKRGIKPSRRDIHVRIYCGPLGGPLANNRSPRSPFILSLGSAAQCLLPDSEILDNIMRRFNKLYHMPPKMIPSSCALDFSVYLAFTRVSGKIDIGTVAQSYICIYVNTDDKIVFSPRSSVWRQSSPPRPQFPYRIFIPMELWGNINLVCSSISLGISPSRRITILRTFLRLGSKESADKTVNTALDLPI
jgi:hypothetical protein